MLRPPGAARLPVAAAAQRATHHFFTFSSFVWRITMVGRIALRGALPFGGALVACALAFSARALDIPYRAHLGTPNALVGWSVANLGDLDGDGVNDYAVGAPFDCEPGFLHASVRIHSGASGDLLHLLVGTTLSGFGWSVASAGDVDADGVPDLLVGSPIDGTDFLSGIVEVYSGRDWRLLRRIEGTMSVGWLGYSVAGVGDVDGDGFDDVAAGGPVADGALADHGGYVVVASGRTGERLYTHHGVGAGGLGFSVAGVGDVNGDGYPDVAAGEPGHRTVVFLDARSQHVIDTLSTPSEAQENFGFAIAAIEDVSGDDAREILVGAPGNPGQVFLFDGSTRALMRTFQAGIAGDNVGFSVAGAGDVNGDGLPDVIAGAPHFGNCDVGRVVAHSFADGGRLGQVRGEGGFTLYGYSVAPLGDVNDDGFDDILVGAPMHDGTAGAALVYLGAPELGTSTGDSDGCPPPDHQGPDRLEGATPGDVTGDGMPDAIGSSPDGRNVVVSPNSGDGEFAGASAYPVHGIVADVAAIDFNRDGRPDLAYTDLQSGRVRFLLHVGDDEMHLVGGIPVGILPTALLAHDLNADARTDLAVVNPTQGKVHVLKAIPGPTSSIYGVDVRRLFSRRSYIVTGSPRAIAAGDVNADGRTDLVVLTSRGVSVLVNKGRCRFRPPLAVAIEDPIDGFDVADVTGDGRADLLRVHHSAPEIVVQPGLADGTFGEAAAAATGAGPRRVVATDFDRDGAIDAATISLGNDSLSILLNDDWIGFHPPYVIPTENIPTTIHADDLDADGAPDLLIGCHGDVTVTTWMNPID
jgi:hypothetical protein